MAQIKFLSGYVDAKTAKRLKSFFIAKFKKESRRDLKIVIEDADKFKVKNIAFREGFIVVAYHKAEVQPIKRTKVFIVAKRVKRVSTKFRHLVKPIFIPVKRVIVINLNNIKWIWQFIKSPQQLSA